MGLDCSHEAFHGAYSAFNRFRRAVSEAIGGSYPPHEDRTLEANAWYWGPGYNEKTHPGLYIFFSHSDCDGEILPEDCVKVADELEQLLPRLDGMGADSGHIARDGGIGEVTRRFIAGCRFASSQNEPLEFR